MDAMEILLCIAIVAIVAIALGMYIKTKKDDKEVEKYLSGLSASILKAIADILAHSSPGDYANLEEFEKAILQKIYDETWEFISGTAEKELADDEIASTLFSLITRERIEAFVKKIIETNDVKTAISNTYADYHIKNSTIEADDQAAIEEYSNQDNYIEESTDEDLNPASEVKHTEEEIAALNPQKDEEEPFDPEDDSMEIITDKIEIISTTDKNGKLRYYEIDANGKKKQVSKAYAEEHMNA